MKFLKTFFSWLFAVVVGLCVGVLFVCWSVGQIIRDADWHSGLCFYIPSPFLAVALVLFAMLLGLLGYRRFAKVAWICAVFPIFFVMCVENSFLGLKFGAQSGEPSSVYASDVAKRANTDSLNAVNLDNEFVAASSTKGKTLRLVHWNVCWGGLGWENIQELLATQEADIYVVSEVPIVPGALAPLLERLGDSYSVLRFRTMSVIARGKLRRGPRVKTHHRLKAHPVVWDCDGRTYEVLAVDMDASVGYARNPILLDLIEILETRQPDLVAGDFNAPRRSLALDDLPIGYQHAYDSVGSGWGYTWPVPAPMYAIDHCIHHQKILPVKFELISSTLSDHRMQVFDFQTRAVAPSRKSDTPMKAGDIQSP